MFLRLGEIVILALLGTFVFTQLVLPPFIRKPFFWLFKKSEKTLMQRESQLMSAKINREGRKIEKEVKKIDRKS
ncbi:MAG: hypothetical protein NUV61_00795 [Candidatus Azambacteria bacterium]|nr:hypothetical protein [Candidatus Azambacteria bacterium]